MSAPRSLAFLAGALSALLYFSVITGSLSGVLLTYLAPLPLFAAGLGLGLNGALVAGVTGTLLITVTGVVLDAGLFVAVPYAVAFAAPVVLLTRQALLSRPADGGLEWYPPGLLLAALTGIAVAYLAIAALLIAISGIDLQADIAAEVGQMFAVLDIPSTPTAIAGMAGYVPPTIAVTWVMLLIINGCLAQGLLVRFDRNLRPSASLMDIALPQPLFILFAAAVAAAFLSGTPGLIGKTLAAIAAVPYFLLGLGTIHRWLQQWPARYIVLIVLYGWIFLLFLPMAVIIVGIGLVTHAGRLRPRGGGRKEE